VHVAVVADVLAQAVLAAATESHDGCPTLPARRDIELKPGKRARVDLERQVSE
jgi:hypothetical protein